MDGHDSALQLFSEVVLLAACEAVRGVHIATAPIVVPPGTKGTLVDQNSQFPHVWTIEFDIKDYGIVLVETTQDHFGPANPR